jgi:hypothetical protein
LVAGVEMLVGVTLGGARGQRLPKGHGRPATRTERKKTDSAATAAPVGRRASF